MDELEKRAGAARAEVARLTNALRARREKRSCGRSGAAHPLKLVVSIAMCDAGGVVRDVLGRSIKGAAFGYSVVECIACGAFFVRGHHGDRLHRLTPKQAKDLAWC